MLVLVPVSLSLIVFLSVPMPLTYVTSVSFSMSVSACVGVFLCACVLVCDVAMCLLVECFFCCCYGSTFQALVFPRGSACALLANELAQEKSLASNEGERRIRLDSSRAAR